MPLISRGEYERKKIDFLKSWIAENSSTGTSGTQIVPDDEQAAAIASVCEHTLVVARAGSGKTETLVNRAFFLLKHCGVDPGELLILAFNHTAASEIRRRLTGLLADSAQAAIAEGILQGQAEDRVVNEAAKRLKVALPHVMTFHALAYAIVHPEQTPLHDDADGARQALSRAVQEVIDTLRQESSFENRFCRFLLNHFREDWERCIVDSHDGMSKEEALRYRRSLRYETLKGDYVKSHGEKVIANFLFEHGVDYKYELNHWWNGLNYRPDFTIPRSGTDNVIIEYFGLRGDPHYDADTENKRQYWRNKNGYELVELFPRDIASGRICRELRERLQDLNVPCTRLTEDEVWRSMRGRAIDRFTKSTTNFISRCRQQSWSSAELRTRIAEHTPLSAVEANYLGLAQETYEAYLARVRTTGEDDFSGLIQRASEMISAGKTVFRRRGYSAGDVSALRFVCIDEYQDFSELFYRLLDAIRQRNPGVGLFCVGDDWQAINGFAGSDLRFFEEYEKYSGKSRRLPILTNYRSSEKIVAAGNALMDGLGEPATAHKSVPGTAFVCDLKQFKPTSVEEQCHPDDRITPAVVRLVGKALHQGLEVVLLCRRNRLPGPGQDLRDYLDLVRRLFPQNEKERIEASTVHRYKGRESSVVILLDVLADSFPLIHPGWVFARILGDSLDRIVKEERRLLYVALTRAVERLIIITESGQESPFLSELRAKRAVDEVEWSRFPPLPGRLLVNVRNQEGRGNEPTYSIREDLKSGGYRWSPERKEWSKCVPKDGFIVDGFKREKWSMAADGVEVLILDHTDTVVARYLVDGGKWRCLFDKLGE